jgi:hypothetical protein
MIGWELMAFFAICVVCAAMSDVTVAAAARDSSVVTWPAMYLYKTFVASKLNLTLHH